MRCGENANREDRHHQRQQAKPSTLRQPYYTRGNRTEQLHTSEPAVRAVQVQSQPARPPAIWRNRQAY